MDFCDDLEDFRKDARNGLLSIGVQIALAIGLGYVVLSALIS